MRVDSRRKSALLFRVRLLQTSGLSLLVLASLNMLFLPQIGGVVNSIFGLFSLLFWWLSFRVWRTSTSRVPKLPSMASPAGISF